MTKSKKKESQLLLDADTVSLYTHANIPWKDMEGFHHWAAAWTRWVINEGNWPPILLLLSTLSSHKGCFVSLTHLTYSADFQKWPGWDRRRFRLGNFSSKSTSLEKLGRSSGL